jgi:hypothetical protein
MFDVRTVAERGWAGISNGQLLALASAEFDVFITLDRNLPFQQHLPKFAIAVILLRKIESNGRPTRFGSEVGVNYSKRKSWRRHSDWPLTFVGADTRRSSVQSQGGSMNLDKSASVGTTRPRAAQLGR